MLRLCSYAYVALYVAGLRDEFIFASKITKSRRVTVSRPVCLGLCCDDESKYIKNKKVLPACKDTPFCFVYSFFLY